MNLATARSARRMREVGMRKVAGAKRKQLVVQFLGESVFIALLALILSLAVTEISLPAISGYLNMQLTLDGTMVPVLFGLALGVGLLAGSYPAFFMSSFGAASVLKETQNTRRGGQAAVRKGLVVVQFAATVVLMIATLIVFQQVRYMRSANMGFNKEALIVTEKTYENTEPIKIQFLQHPGVKHVTRISKAMGVEDVNDTFTVRSSKTGDPKRLYEFIVDPDFLETLEIPLLSGRNFTTRDMYGRVLLNQTAAQILDVKPGDILYAANREFHVIGIIHDFHRMSLQHTINPQVFHSPRRGGGNNYVIIRVDMHNLPDVMGHLAKVWKRVHPGQSFEYSFMDDTIEQLYRAEETQSQMFALGSILAIAIACLGLLGLVAYTAEVRTREIGIRKALGATEVSIVGLLTREFLILVALASLLAYPVAYYATSDWLRNFAYRIDLNPLYFVASTVAALIIALATISYQALKAARANPVDALRYE